METDKKPKKIYDTTYKSKHSTTLNRKYLIGQEKYNSTCFETLDYKSFKLQEDVVFDFHDQTIKHDARDLTLSNPQRLLTHQSYRSGGT